ncbi:MAG: hypothetical protein ACOX8U_10230, partial [Bradymonadia bacterium]
PQTPAPQRPGSPFAYKLVFPKYRGGSLGSPRKMHNERILCAGSTNSRNRAQNFCVNCVFYEEA